MPYSDPIVEEIREMRDGIAARFNYDVEKILDYYMQRQADNDAVVYTEQPETLKNSCRINDRSLLTLALVFAEWQNSEKPPKSSD